MILHDQLNRKLQIAQTPERIVSLVPSITELLFDIGLGEFIVGRTKFCIHPKDILAVAKIGGTKNPDISKINALKPDLVISNKEENNIEDVEAIADFSPVYVSNINNINDLLGLIADLKIIFPNAITDEVINKLNLISQSKTQKIPIINTCYLIWQDPLMTVGGDTFINYMLEHYGFKNIFYDQKRYPSPTNDHIKSLKPEVIMLSSEPYPFGEKHINYYEKLFPYSKVILVDGEAFSWYGSRIIKTNDYLIKLYTSVLE